VAGVDVAVNVGLDHGVHGDHAQAADQLRVVADLLRAQHDARAVKVDVLPEFGVGLWAERYGRGRGKSQLARAQHGQHAVLQHLGVGGQVLKRPLVQAVQHRVGHVAHPRLQRQQLRGQAAKAHLLLQKREDVPGNLGRYLAGRIKGRVAIGLVGDHHSDHFGRIKTQIRVANAVLRARQANGLAVWRQVGAVVNVVHALQRQALVQIHLQNDLVGLVQPGLVVAHRGRRDQPPPGQDARHLDHGHIKVTQQTRPSGLRHMRQMHVGVEHVPGIDLLAASRVGLVGQAHFDALSPGPVDAPVHKPMRACICPAACKAASRAASA